MKLPFYQVDSFTSEVFGGNPAAVCPLPEWLPDKTLQSIASENNLSETAFYVIEETDGREQIELRWFTPKGEVDLCGHATLASAFVMFTEHGYPKDRIYFNTKSGVLNVRKSDHGLTMDFPLWSYNEKPTPDLLYDALSPHPSEYYVGKDVMAVFESADEVRELDPDMKMLAQCKDTRGIIVTAPGDNGYDFISRAFFPNLGIPEDPVTGSAHCMIAPYWAERLGKTTLKAYQASARGGDLLCEIKNERLELTGQAVLYAKGEIYV